MQLFDPRTSAPSAVKNSWPQKGAKGTGWIPFEQKETKGTKAVSSNQKLLNTPSVVQFSKKMPGKVFFDLTMPRYGLARASLWILIPIMPAAMPDEFASFHAICSFATRRTPGM
jgi:hypothetical protein